MGLENRTAGVKALKKVGSFLVEETYASNMGHILCAVH